MGKRILEAELPLCGMGRLFGRAVARTQPNNPLCGFVRPFAMVTNFRGTYSGDLDGEAGHSYLASLLDILIKMWCESFTSIEGGVAAAFCRQLCGPRILVGEQMSMSRESVTSADGVRVHLLVAGSGRPVVIVPGTLAPIELYLSLARSLADRYRVIIVGRRGYGTTEVGPRPCRVENQVDDLVAVLTMLAEPAVLFGHSFGGVISLSATGRIASQVTRLMLYELPVALLGSALEPMLRTCNDLIAAGRPQDAVRVAFQVSGSPDSGNAGFGDGMLSRLVELVPGLIADLECVTTMTVPVQEWSAVTTPLHLIGGEHSTSEYGRSIELLQAMYPNCECTILAGQAHFPRDMTPIANLVAN
jgi:pimeloyl-ACP methyl ester carboxylesterase